MEYIDIVKREYMRIKHTQFKEHVDINITLQELGLDEVLRDIAPKLYFQSMYKYYRIQQRLIESVEEIIDENIIEKDFSTIIKKHLKKKDKVPSKFKFMFITVRPPDDKYDPETFVGLIQRAFTDRQYEMVVEQTGDSDITEGNGNHIHAIVERLDTVAPGEDKQGLFRKLNNIGNTKIDWHIEDHREDKQQYMGKHVLTCGDHIISTYLSPPLANWKDTEEKNKKLPYDFTLRMKYNMKHYYNTCADD